jgi:hypothetical protein
VGALISRDMQDKTHGGVYVGLCGVVWAFHRFQNSEGPFAAGVLSHDTCTGMAVTTLGTKDQTQWKVATSTFHCFHSKAVLRLL